MEAGRVELGQRVRGLRKQNGKTLSDVALDTGLSTATLSKIENGSIAVTYDTLMKLAAAFDLTPAALLSDAHAAVKTGAAPRGLRSVTRQDQGDVYETDRYRYEILGSDLSAKKMLPMLTTIQTGLGVDPRDMIRHPGEEFIFILSGRVELRTEFYAPLVLEPGDSTYFDSSMGHSLAALGDEPARVLWVSTNDSPAAHVGARPRMARSPRARVEKVS